MSFQLIVNGGERTYTGRDGESLFQALTRNSMFIPTACGGQGKCGMCRLRVLSGNHEDYTESEMKLLKEEDRQKGYRLACQMRPRAGEDIQLEVPASYYSVGKYKVRLLSRKFLTGDILHVRVQAVEPKFIRVEAGCWMAWNIPAYGGVSEGFQRAFSVASDPKDRRVIEFIIRRTPCGPGTTWLFDVAKEGDELYLTGPQGEFRLHENPREAVMIAGGSGLSAIRCLLLDMRTRKVQKKCRLFFGAVNLQNLYMTDELTALKKDMFDYDFIPVLSRPNPDDVWNGKTGPITCAVADYYESCKGMEAYLCGSPGMLQACIRMLVEKGMDEKDIFYDKFV